MIMSDESQRSMYTYVRSTTKDLAALVKSKGVTILWRGLGPTLWRDVPFSGRSLLPTRDPLHSLTHAGLYWAGFEILKSHLSSSQSTLPPMTPIATSFVSGALSGTFAALLTQPFDVLKTRRQVFTPSPDARLRRFVTARAHFRSLCTLSRQKGGAHCLQARCRGAARWPRVRSYDRVL